MHCLRRKIQSDDLTCYWRLEIKLFNNDSNSEERLKEIALVNSVL